jgi:hypothetical protein
VKVSALRRFATLAERWHFTGLADGTLAALPRFAMTTKTWLKAFLMVSTVAATLTTGCTMTLGDHSVVVSSPANPGTREAVAHTSGASLAYDDHPARGR